VAKAGDLHLPWNKPFVMFGHGMGALLAYEVRPGMSAVVSWPATVQGDGAPLAPPTEHVDCWAVALAALPAEAEGAALALLSASERERMERFCFERHRRLYGRSHAALRLLIARYVGASPASLLIAPDANGRPLLASPAGRLHFNLSHSGEAALFAVSCSAAVGVDVEVVRDVPDFAAIARRHFAPTEVEFLLGLAPEERLGGFYVTWTRKEAFVKALGLGLSFPLDAFCTGRPDGRPDLRRAGGAAYTDWTMADLKPAIGYKGAVAIHRPNHAIRCRQAGWPWLLDAIK
jgi:4'-phosphopantetheinyl transferase